MQLQSAYPIIVVDRSKLSACRDFYLQYLGFEVVFEASWFVYMAASDSSPHGIAFMADDHPSQPPGPETFSGSGMLFTLQVADAAAEYERLQSAGALIAYPLHDEVWGQRRFGMHDPAGTWLDIVQQIAPAEGFWDAYLPGSAASSR